MSEDEEEFQEIGHCGGQFIVTVETDEEGRRGIQLGWQHCRPTAAAIFAVYALPQGIPVGTIQLGGIGEPWNPPPGPGCMSIFIASDRQGMFGHQCPECGGYWRSDGAPSRWMQTCPYCGIRSDAHVFLTDGQKRYTGACCEKIHEAMSSEEDGEFIVDMDEIADLVGKEGEKPPLYYAEESQQNKYDCPACDGHNDILGRYGYCSNCGTHNGIHELEKEIEKIREEIRDTSNYEACAKDVVAAFDSYARQVSKQLAGRIPMTPKRKREWTKKLFHNLANSAEGLKTVFDIDPFKGVKQDDVDFATRMFHRRHVYEHNGGEVDEKYIKDSGDISVRPKQVIRETAESASRIASLVLAIARNIHDAFHAIFPPENEPIQYHQDHLATLAQETDNLD